MLDVTCLIQPRGNAPLFFRKMHTKESLAAPLSVPPPCSDIVLNRYAQMVPGSSQTSIKKWLDDGVVTALRQYKALLLPGKLEVSAVGGVEACCWDVFHDLQVQLEHCNTVRHSTAQHSQVQDITARATHVGVSYGELRYSSFVRNDVPSTEEQGALWQVSTMPTAMVSQPLTDWPGLPLS